MVAEKLEKLMEDAWKVAVRNSRRPISSISLPNDLAIEVARLTMESVLATHEELPSRSDLMAFVVKFSKKSALRCVARERHRTGDQDHYRNPNVSANAQANLNFSKLANHDDQEWSELEKRLRPFTAHLLARGSIHDYESDLDDLFTDSMAALVRPRAADGKAPVDLMIVYEDILSMYSAIVKRKAIDWVRRRTSLKNQPNVQESVNQMEDDQDHAVILPDPGTSRQDDAIFDTLTFDVIHERCRDCLSEGQWDLLTRMFVEGSATRAELIDDPELLATLEIDPRSSSSTRRRRLDECLLHSLGSLKQCLERNF